MGMTNVGGPLRIGGATGVGNVKGDLGVLTSPVYVYQIVPTTASTVTVVAAQGKDAAGNLTLNGSLVSSGVATLDVPRNIQVVSTSADDTTLTSTVTGTDTYGITLVETITYNGTTAAQGLKAFKTVTNVSVSGSTAGTVAAGPGDTFGSPYYFSNAGSVQAFWDATWNNGSGATVAGTTATATATTGDVRGTYTPATASNGTRSLSLWIYAEDSDSNTGLYGVTQYGG